jgi:hypothetical protein
MDKIKYINQVCLRFNPKNLFHSSKKSSKKSFLILTLILKKSFLIFKIFSKRPKPSSTSNQAKIYRGHNYNTMIMMMMRRIVDKRPSQMLKREDGVEKCCYDSHTHTHTKTHRLSLILLIFFFKA